jgi:hypothetical protein
VHENRNGSERSHSGLEQSVRRGRFIQIGSNEGRAQFARERCSGFFRDIAYDQSDAFSGQSFRDAASNS